MNYTTQSVEVLMENNSAEQWERFREMGRQSIAEAANHPSVLDGSWATENAPRYILADKIKDLVTDMVDDVQVKSLNYARYCIKQRGKAPEVAEVEFRQVLVQSLVVAALGAIDYHDLADTVFQSLADADRRGD